MINRLLLLTRIEGCGRWPRVAAVAAALALGLLVPAATGASVKALLSDCALDGELNARYSASAYEGALKHLPTDMREYTDCQDVIRRGQLGLGGSTDRKSAAVGASQGSGGGPSTPSPDAGGGVNAYERTLAAATPQERASVARAVSGTAGTPRIAGVRPRRVSVAHGDLSSSNRLPAPLLVVLVLLGCGLVTAAASSTTSVMRSRSRGTA